MSSNTQNDETSQRLGRLKAMQARRKEVIDRAVPSTAVRPDVTEVTAVQPAKAGGAGGGRAALIQQVRKLITGPNGTIDQKKAKLLVQFVKRQANDPSAPRHEQAKKILEVFNNLDADVRRKVIGRVAGTGRKAGIAGAGRGAGGDKGSLAGRRAGKIETKAQTVEDGNGSWFDDLVNKI